MQSILINASISRMSNYFREAFKHILNYCNTSYQFRLGLMYFGDKFKMFSITVYVEI